MFVDSNLNNPDSSNSLDLSSRLLESFAHADQVEISVGYASVASLEKLDQLIETYHIKKVYLSLGMYFFEGIPEKLYGVALTYNKKWTDAGVGQIALVNEFKSHAKLFAFYNQGKPFRCFNASSNLSILAPDAMTRRQYEAGSVFEDPIECESIASKIREIFTTCSQPIDQVKNINKIREFNTALNGIDLIKKVPSTDLERYHAKGSDLSFSLRLKVPSYKDRFKDDGKHYTRSNVNVCYSAPRNKKNPKPRDWYEMQLTVGSNIYKKEGYPEKNKPFIIITDDGYLFKAHTTSDNNKQFSAVGNELILGRWLKGRLEAAGLVRSIDNINDDTDRQCMITQEMLDIYGCNALVFEKTKYKYHWDKDLSFLSSKNIVKADNVDENSESKDKGQDLDIWLLSFVQEQN